jgi:hypothetical protein
MAQSSFLEQWFDNFYAKFKDPEPVDILGAAVGAFSGVVSPLAGVVWRN